MFKKVITLRVDVDTSAGLKKGVPQLLDIFQRYGVPATFFIVMGPDSMGRHILRLGKKGYIKRIISVNPFRLISGYGIRPFLYGTLMRNPPLVGGSAPEVIRRILNEGHEIGLHSYNHADWADRFEEFGVEHVRAEFKKALSEYEKLTSKKPVSSACPNWRCNDKILAAEDSFSFLYLSDMRGKYPFFPITDKETLKTLQIPQTMPTIHEYLQLGIYSRGNVVDGILKGLKEDVLNVFTMHDWLEGMICPDCANELIEKAIKRGFTFKSLATCAQELLQDRTRIPVCRISLKAIPGGIGKVACQEVN